MINRLIATSAFAFALGIIACSPNASQSDKPASSDFDQEIIAAPAGEWLSHGRTYG